MVVSLAGVTTDFLQRIERVIERTEHRRAQNADDEALIRRTRRNAEARRHSAWVIEEGDLIEDEDDASSVRFDIMTYLDGDFASTFRIQIGAGEDAALPSRTAFADILTRQLRAGRVIVDFTRIAVKPEYVCRFPELPYLTVRVAWLAAQHFEADLITMTCLDNHRPVYERAFGFEPLGAPVHAREFGRTLACMGLDCRAGKARIEGRYPMFRSTDFERRSIFGGAEDLVAGERGEVSRRRQARKRVSLAEARIA